MNKDHCHYCDRALYKMYLTQGVYSHVDDTERHDNSDGVRICGKCKSRLLPRGTRLRCVHCDTPIYELKHDQFKEDLIRRRNLKGIAPQPDPYENAFIKCRHCNKEVNTWG